MEKFLKPTRLDLDHRSKDSHKLWAHWKKTLDNFFTSFQTAPDDATKLSALINFVSPEIYEYISNQASYEEAIDQLEGLYVKPKNEIFARHCLLTRNQHDGESIDEYKHALESLANECEFKDITGVLYRDAYVRDAFICGIKSSDIRQRLLEEDLPLEKSFEKARSYELAARNSERIASSNPVINALSVADNQNLLNNEPPETCAATWRSNNYQQNPSKLSQRNSSGNCFYCGFQVHARDSCPAREAVCHSCGTRGHFAKVCRKSKKAGTFKQDRSSSRFVSALPSSLSDAVISAKVSHYDLNVLVDTGSSESYINSLSVKNLELDVNENDCHNVQMASTNHESQTLGSICVDITIGEHVYHNCKLKILPELCCDVILGHDVLSQHEKVVIDFGGHRSPLNIDNISKSGFACSLTPMHIQPVPLFEHLNSDVRPIRCNSRQHSKPDLDFISEKIEELLSDGRIEPSSSPWRAQVLVTSNERHRKRMVVDYSRTINKFCELDGYPFPNIDDMANKVAQFSFYSTFDLKSAYHQVPIRDSDKPYTAFEAAGRLYQFTCIPYGVSNGVSAFQRAIDQIIDENGLKNTYAYLDNITVCGHSQDELESDVAKFLRVVDKYGMTLNHDKTVKSASEIKILGYQISKGTIKPDPDRLSPLVNLSLPIDSASLKRALGLFSYYSKWIPKFSEKVQPLIKNPEFPLGENVQKSFAEIKECIMAACLVCPNENDLLVVETDASDRCLSASLNQNGRPVAFFSRTLNNHEKHHSSVEKEACAIVEAVRKWRHYLCGRRFLLLTDQQAVSFIFDPAKHGKIKNDKLLRWRIELSCYDFDIKFRPGRDNAAADCLSRITASVPSFDSLQKIHSALCHPGITRMIHLIRSRNLPYSVDDVKKVITNCSVCAKLKPSFYRPSNPPLVKATQPMERISIDFKGPLPTVSANKYILTVVDEFSRFPFAFPCKDLHTDTVKRCLTELFSVFGQPGFVHSDRGSSFISDGLKSFFISQGIGSSHSSPYNPRGNGQCERYNAIIWKTVQLALSDRGLEDCHWEVVLPDALHSIRSLLSTATNQTPHERFLGYSRRTASGPILPTWLLEKGKALLRRHVRPSKYDPLVDEVEIVDTNPCYARVCLPNGREKTVSLRDLAPVPRSKTVQISEPPVRIESATTEQPPTETIPPPNTDCVLEPPPISTPEILEDTTSSKPKRDVKPPSRLEYTKMGG